MSHILTALTLAATLAACVPAHNWTPGPQIAASDFERDKARCSIAARHSGEGGFVFGPPAFVIGAAIGSAIGSANRTQADVNDCLAAIGWVAVE